MPRYYPIDIGVPLRASRSDLAAFTWATNGITADFFLPDNDENLLRVSFLGQCIVRILDDMPLGTEDEDTPNEGLVNEHFAYRLEDAAFARHQSSAWKLCQVVTHYRFITGMACLDVLTRGTISLSFSVVQTT
jgi:hypothetical protein